MPPPLAQTPDVLPLSAADRAQWWEAIAHARQVRQKIMVWADANLKAYAPPLDSSPTQYGEAINTNRDFTLVERKKADLFYQKPDVVAVPSPLFQDQPALLDVHTQILNEKLGPDGVDVEALVDRVLFDVLCPTGTGWTIMGYESATVPTPMQVPDESATMPGAVLGLHPPLAYKEVMAPRPIYQDCFWNWFSPKCALMPHNARTTESDTWPWIGMEFEVPVKVAKDKGWVSERYQGGPSSPDLHFDQGAGSGSDTVARGVLIYYQSSIYRDDRPHPRHQTQLILMEGEDAPAAHKDSPYQAIDPTGTLTPDSLLGYPIHPCTIRVLTDSAYVPSDCTVSRPIVNELNTFRDQMLQQRDANLLRWMVSAAVPPADVAKIKRSPIGGLCIVPEEFLVGETAFKEFPQGSYPRENFQFTDILDNDLARTHALDANQSGASNSGTQSATESQIQQNNVNARLGRERGRVLKWYLSGVTKYSSILQRLLPVDDAAKIVGQQPAAEWDQWRKIVPASLAFTAQPDASQRSDTASERKLAMDQYSFLINAPGINKVELTKQLLPKLRIPNKVLETQPPQPAPEPTKPTFSFKGDDLNPLAPQFTIVMEILRQAGVTVSPEAVQQAQAAAQNALLATHPAIAPDTGQGAPPPTDQHGGKLPQLENLSKHAEALTGAMQGTGAPAPLGPGGTVQ